MQKLIPIQLMIFLIQIICLLGVARLFGELVKKFDLPIVLGELLAGVILGPTVFGTLAPDFFASLFHLPIDAGLALDGLMSLSVIFLLFVVGMEIELNEIARQGTRVVWFSVLGILIPVLIGTGVGWLIYDMSGVSVSRPLFAAFMGAALSISALPVIARILLDLKLLKTPLGNLTIAVATMNDAVGWMLFIIVLSLSWLAKQNVSIGVSIAFTVGLGLLVVTALPRIMDMILGFVARTMSPGGIIGTAVVMMLILAVVTEYVGIHAVFGAFAAGIGVSQSRYFTPELKHSIIEFTSHILAPLFFAAVGLKVNFFNSFDLTTILIILLAAYGSKMLAAWIGGYFAHLTLRESTAVGLGIAARGGMGIILATIALEAKFITPRIFTALVLMAIITSMSAGFIKAFSVPVTEQKGGASENCQSM
jgi:Kef-type K+ transport system membrane component KefB